MFAAVSCKQHSTGPLWTTLYSAINSGHVPTPATNTVAGTTPTARMTGTDAPSNAHDERNNDDDKDGERTEVPKNN